MKTLILDGTEKNNHFAENVNRSILKNLKEKEIRANHLILNQHLINGCIGCLDCFFKNPGTCIFNDLVRKLPQEFIQSEVVILITPVTFCGFSSILAKAYCRLVIQLESHLFESSEGILIRKERYPKKSPSLMVFGLEENSDLEGRKVFTDLVAQTDFDHIHSPNYKVVFLPKDKPMNDINSIVKNIITEIGDKK